MKRRDDHWMLTEIYIDGHNLFDLILTHEEKYWNEAFDFIGGSPYGLYSWLHESSGRNGVPENTHTLYTCPCSDAGCGEVLVQIKEENNTVHWQAFYDSFSKEKALAEMPSFVFTKEQYQQALAKLREWKEQRLYIAIESHIRIFNEKGKPVYFFELYPKYPRLIDEIDDAINNRIISYDEYETESAAEELELAYELKALLPPGFTMYYLHHRL